MELKLSRAFFWPTNSTIVRTVKFSSALLWQRSLYRVLWRMAPQAAIERAARQMLTPPPYRFADAELRFLEEASLVPVPFVTGRLVAWRWGRTRDPLVVLLHGWGGRGTQLSPLVEPLVKRGYSVVSFDAPGHGMTGGPESSLPHFQRALDAVLDHFGPAHALVGHSLGGAVAAMALALRPEKAGRAVTIGAPASLAANSRRVAELLGWPDALRAAVQRRIEYRFGVSWDSFETERNAAASDLLVIHDRADREVPFAEAQRHVRAWPKARLLETAGLGHTRILRDPTVIAATLDFIDGGRR